MVVLSAPECIRIQVYAGGVKGQGRASVGVCGTVPARMVGGGPTPYHFWGHTVRANTTYGRTVYGEYDTGAEL